MLRLVFSGFFLLVLNFITSCEGFDGYGSEYEELLGQKSSLPGTIALPKFTFVFPEQRGLGISAWGIVTICVLIILAIMGMYFVSICFPVLCKKPRKYGVMDTPPV